MFCDLFYEGELVFAFFDDAEAVDGLLGGDFGAVDRDGVTRNKLARFAFAGGEAGFGEDVGEAAADLGNREALGKKINIFIG